MLIRRLFIIGCIFMSGPMSAQMTLTIDHIDVSKYPRARIFADILDVQREPIVGLSSNQFEVGVGKLSVDTPLHVQSFGESGIGVSIVLGIDASGTMAGRPLEQAKQA